MEETPEHKCLYKWTLNVIVSILQMKEVHLTKADLVLGH